MKEYKNIALVKLSAIGDVVHALPVASALRKRYPHSHLTWIVEGKSREIVDGNPDLDEVIVFEKARWVKEFPYPHRTFPVLWEIFRFSRQLRKANFDLVIDLQGLIKSGVLTWLAGTGTRIGFSVDYCRESANARFTNYHITPAKEDVHIIDQCLSLVRELETDTQHKQFKIHVPEKDRKYIEKFLEKKGVSKADFLLLINPGAAWETKQWGVENYAQLADQVISDLGLMVIFLWGPSELTLVKSIQKKMRQPAIRACPTTLKQSMALMQQAHLFVSGDTGPLHIAAALNIPCVGIYGPSSPERNGPYGKIHRVVQTNVSCRNCFRRFCSNQECMKSIPVSRVMETIRDMVKGGYC